MEKKEKINRVRNQAYRIATIVNEKTTATDPNYYTSCDYLKTELLADKFLRLDSIIYDKMTINYKDF